MQKSDKKRPRALQACLTCRARKNRCNEELPCIYCVEHDLECVYTRPHREKRRTLAQNVEQSPLAAELEVPPALSASNQPAEGINQHVSTGRLQQAASQSGSPPMSSHRGQERLSPAKVSSFTQRLEPYRFSTGHHQSILTSQDSAVDIIDTNTHTKNLEYYGASSSVAFLRHVDNIAVDHVSEHVTGNPERSLASLLHNTSFRPYTTPSTISEPIQGNNDRFHFRVARRFIEAYFSNIHHVQPIFDEEVFLARCEDLWFDKSEKQPRSFVALYYVTLSLGSLVMDWDDREIYGADRFSWSRQFFNEAVSIVTQLCSGTDLEMVQCYYMMGKVCQHELNPHVAYLYSGQATRTALAIGLNRSTDEQPPSSGSSITAAMTWWAVYCLDIQTSFALGRPDSLGPDEYHTQSIPGSAASYGTEKSTTGLQVLQIIPCMVDLSRIMRRVSLLLYTIPCSTQEKVFRVRELDTVLSLWVQGLPPNLRLVESPERGSSLKPRLRQTANYMKKQSVVLMIRYYNLRMIIHGKFMTSEAVGEDLEIAVRECQQICIDSAGHTIDLIYDTFKSDNFFQTWWYNSTYTMFAATILLTAIFHGFAKSKEALNLLFTQIDRAIAVLEAMEECVVTRNATLIIKKTLARAKKTSQRVAPEPVNTPIPGAGSFRERPSWIESSSDSTNNMFSAENILVPEDNEATYSGDWMDMAFLNDDSQQAMFWIEWAHHLDELGA